MDDFQANYYYKVYYGSTILHDSGDIDDYFETEEEAREDAESYIEQKIAEWKMENVWSEYDNEEDFSIEIEEVD